MSKRYHTSSTLFIGVIIILTVLGLYELYAKPRSSAKNQAVEIPLVGNQYKVLHLNIWNSNEWNKRKHDFQRMVNETNPDVIRKKKEHRCIHKRFKKIRHLSL